MSSNAELLPYQDEPFASANLGVDWSSEGSEEEDSPNAGVEPPDEAANKGKQTYVRPTVQVQRLAELKWPEVYILMWHNRF